MLRTYTIYALKKGFMLYLVFINLLYAIGYPLTKVVVDTMPPLLFLGVRLLLTGIAPLFYLGFIKKALTLRWKSLGLISLSSILSIYLYNALALWGLATVAATKAAFLDNTAVLMSALLEWIIFSERLTAFEWIGLGLITLGTTPFFSPVDVLSQLSYMPGEITIILANIAWTCGFILIRDLYKDKNFDPFMLTSVSMIIGGILAVAHSFFTEQWSQIDIASCIHNRFDVLALALIYHGSVDHIYTTIAPRYTVTMLTLSSFSIPFLTSVLEALFLGVPINSTVGIAGIFISMGAVCSVYKHQLEKSLRTLFMRPSKASV